ncbi:hypothetical protein CEXT_612241 [Caerostris extrusa]|uniref:Uncharacterized protein n=1 Tax=Caerostris extrusa TaxID=172846 RepID=A0AAV4P7E4_CAEEX|nr:hypothetical protein CEXT_612241 [Caerostris extrusa]
MICFSGFTKKTHQLSQNNNGSKASIYRNVSLPTYQFLPLNYSEKPISWQAAHTKHQPAPTRNNRTTIRHWHHLVSKPVVKQKLRNKEFHETTRWSTLRTKQNPSNGSEVKTTGSVKSVKISEILI